MSTDHGTSNSVERKNPQLSNAAITFLPPGRGNVILTREGNSVPTTSRCLKVSTADSPGVHTDQSGVPFSPERALKQSSCVNLLGIIHRQFACSTVLFKSSDVKTRLQTIVSSTCSLNTERSTLPGCPVVYNAFHITRNLTKSNCRFLYFFF